MSGDPAFVMIMAAIVVVAFGTALRFVQRLFELRHERLLRTPPETFSALSQRLDRIENAVETTALEVERISEANRFMAKLLAERGAAIAASTSAPSPRSERVITPH
jgi:hypothetical protein